MITATTIDTPVGPLSLVLDSDGTVLASGFGDLGELTSRLDDTGDLRLDLADGCAFAHDLFDIAFGGLLLMVVGELSLLAVLTDSPLQQEFELAEDDRLAQVVIGAGSDAAHAEHNHLCIAGADHLGAGQPERAEKSTWLAARYKLVFQSCIGIFLLTAAPFIANLFTNDPDVLRIGTDCLRILAIGAPAYAIGMIVTQAINGSGDTATPTAIDFVGFWLVQIPLAYWLATSLSLEQNGAFWAITVAETLITVLAVIVFRSGRWKRTIA